MVFLKLVVNESRSKFFLKDVKFEPFEPGTARELRASNVLGPCSGHFIFLGSKILNSIMPRLGTS